MTTSTDDYEQWLADREEFEDWYFRTYWTDDPEET